nr:vacuolar protein sorting-associated protein 37B-like [Pseudochaenichthys georgianus]XP_033935188.1 vacuolar protein sorting-associated protein 37B-like [Pseudochaenichthys georgianus]
MLECFLTLSHSPLVSLKLTLNHRTILCLQNMADCFLDGDMPLDSFIDSYQSNRKLAHLRRVKIEKLQEMVMNGHRLPTVPNSRSQDVPSSVASLINGSSGSSPTAQPRRKNPPSQPAPILNQYPAAELPAVYSPYPPIPPRTGQPFPNVSSGYPAHFMSQYPPAVPQRPAPRLAPTPGFIMQ